MDSGKEKLDICACEEVLSHDPAGLYEMLCPASKKFYRDRVGELSVDWGIPASKIGEAVLELARAHSVHPDQEQRLESHVGLYLLEREGLAKVAAKMGVTTDVIGSARPRAPCILLSVYLTATLLLTVIFGCLFIHRNDPLGVALVVLPSLMLISASTVKSWIAEEAHRFYPMPFLPRLMLENGITAQRKTLVVIPVLLLSDMHANELIEVLKRHYAAVQDPNVLFALLTDFPDSDEEEPSSQERDIIESCAQSIRDLNNDPSYEGREPFLLLHRNRSFSATQGRWMGWERKRGKIIQVISYIVSGADPFADRVGDIKRLRDTKYLMVLDEDSRLEKDTLRCLVGTHGHPLNHPHIDPSGKAVTRGYGMLQPEIRSIAELDRGDLKRGAPGRVLWQDVFQQCTYTGKGIIHVATYHKILDGSIPPERILSHDIVESVLLRTGAATSARMFEPIGMGHEAECIRRHRWIRGDWQNSWLLSSNWRGIELSTFGRTVIVDLLLDSLLPIAVVIVVIRGVSVTHFALAALLLVVTGRIWTRALWMASVALRKVQLLNACKALCEILIVPVAAFLLVEEIAHQAVISSDAIGRTAYRMSCGRRLLEWRTTAYAEKHRSRYNLCSVCRLMEAFVFLATAGFVWHAHRNIPLCALLVIWALQPRNLFSRRHL